jgi:Spy/CpxP family protein refolding chaperone
MKKKCLIVTGILVLGMAIAVTVAFGGHGMAGSKSVDGHKAEFMRYYLAGRLDLTEEQKVQLGGMFSDLAALHSRMHAAREELKTRLHEQLSEESVTPQAVQQILEGKRPLIDEMISAISEKIAAFHGMLTPEQRETLLSELQDHEGRCRFGR